MSNGRDWFSYGPVRGTVRGLAAHIGISQASGAGQTMALVHRLHHRPGSRAVYDSCGIPTAVLRYLSLEC